MVQMLIALRRKMLNINLKICFTVVEKIEILPSKFLTKYESVIAFVQIKVSEDKQDILRKILQKYSPRVFG